MAKAAKAAKTTAVKKEGYCPFNGLITLNGLTVTHHRKSITHKAKTADEAEAKFNEFVNDTQFGQ